MDNLTSFDKPREQNRATSVINPDIRFIERDNFKMLTVVNHPIFTYHSADLESERYLIAQLSRNNLATQKELAHSFNISQTTVKNYKSRLIRHGLRGILYEKPALKEPRKITPQVIREVLAYYFVHSTAGENEIAKQVSLRLGFSISHSSVSRILEQCGFKLKGERRAIEPFEDIINELQMEPPFSSFSPISDSLKPKQIPENHTTANKMFSSRYIKNFFVTSELEYGSPHRNRIYCCVFCQNVPVASFYEKDLPSQKIAAIHLVESGLATQNDAAEVVGVHRNTVYKAVRINRLFGIRCVIRDNRGPKKPYHYTPERQAYIITLIKNHPNWKDDNIAKKAAKELKTRVSRQAIARIRITLPQGKRKTRRKSEIRKVDNRASIVMGTTKTEEKLKTINKKKTKKIYL